MRLVVWAFILGLAAPAGAQDFWKHWGDGKAEVIVDGGFTRGTDVVKAIALGARAVLIGKLQAWALGAGGKIAIYNSWGKTNVVGDVMGFYRSAGATPATDGSYGSFEPAGTPTRILDTRRTTLGPGYPLPPYSWIPVCVDFQDAAVNAHTKASSR